MSRMMLMRNKLLMCEGGAGQIERSLIDFFLRRFFL